MTAATMRQETAGKVRRLAADVQSSHPTMGAHDHLRDAARALDSGNTEGAGRHLRAAIEQFTPLSLMRHGHLEDEAHMKGKQHMDSANRMLLLVRDAEDTQYKEESAREAKRAMNAPGPVPEGRPDGAARGPAAQGPARRLPAKSWPAATSQSAGPVLTSNPVDLAFWQTEARDRHGEWTGLAGLDLDQVERQHGSEAAGHLRAADTAARSGRKDEALGHLDRAHQIISQHTIQTLAGMDKHIARATLNSIRDNRRRVLNLASGPQTISDWAQVYELALETADAVELSAQTARLASTPRPYGEPGGPGLYHVKGLKHSDYLENIVHALMTKRGFDKGKATAIARGAIRKWMRGGGKVHPEVRAAAAGAEAEEVAAQARAHAHANDAGREILLFNPNHDATGKFSTAQNAQQAKGKQGKGKHPAKGKHVNAAQRARAKGALLMQARNDIARADALRAQIRALEAQLRGSSGRSGATAASSGATKASSTATKAASTAASSAKSAASAASSRTSAGRQAIANRISALRSQVHGLMQAAHTAQAQAAKL